MGEERRGLRGEEGRGLGEKPLFYKIKKESETRPPLPPLPPPERSGRRRG